MVSLGITKRAGQANMLPSGNPVFSSLESPRILAQTTTATFSAN